MAISRINLGTAPSGTGGDTNRSAFKKIDDNFSASENAASRLVGTSIGNIPDMTIMGLRGVGLGSTSTGDIIEGSGYAEPCGFYRTKFNDAAMPAGSYSLMRTKYDAFTLCDIAFLQSTSKPKLYVRTGYALTTTPTTTPWSEIYHSRSESIFTTTTASSPNVFVTSTGELQRSTSSERYKDIIGDLTLDDVAYKNAMTLHPIVYRSAASADSPNWHYYSFSAEKLGAFDKAFTLWRDTETITTDNGEVKEVLLDKPVAEGINLNALVAFLHATNIKQHKLIEKLSKRVEALENAKQ